MQGGMEQSGGHLGMADKVSFIFKLEFITGTKMEPCWEKKNVLLEYVLQHWKQSALKHAPGIWKVTERPNLMIPQEFINL